MSGRRAPHGRRGLPLQIFASAEGSENFCGEDENQLDTDQPSNNDIWTDLMPEDMVPTYGRQPDYIDPSYYEQENMSMDDSEERNTPEYKKRRRECEQEIALIMHEVQLQHDRNHQKLVDEMEAFWAGSTKEAMEREAMQRGNPTWVVEGLHGVHLQSPEGPRLQIEGGGHVENLNQTPTIQTHVRPRSSSGSSPPSREHKKLFVKNAEMGVDYGSDAQNFGSSPRYQGSTAPNTPRTGIRPSLSILDYLRHRCNQKLIGK